MVKQAVVKRIHELRAAKNGFRFGQSLTDNNPRTVAFVENAPAVVAGKPSKRQLIAFRTPPCTHGKCTMCGFGSEAVRSLTLEELKAQLESVELIEEGRISLCTESSFFHPGIPPDFLGYAMERIREREGIREVDLEACAQEVVGNIERIRSLKARLREDQQLYVGMGLESRDDFIRNVLIGKALPKELFESAIHLLAEAGVGAYTYILLKPPGLEEGEAITECIRTVQYFFGIAKREGIEAARATIKPLFIPRGTIVEKLSEEGLIDTPKLWSLLEVLKEVHSLGTIFSPLTDEGVSDGRIPGNCNSCTPEVRKAIERFNAWQEITPLLELICECKTEWERAVKENETAQ